MSRSADLNRAVPLHRLLSTLDANGREELDWFCRDVATIPTPNRFTPHHPDPPTLTGTHDRSEIGLHGRAVRANAHRSRPV